MLSVQTDKKVKHKNETAVFLSVGVVKSASPTRIVITNTWAVFLKHYDFVMG